ncbi:MAG TPA: amidohydrolase family protein, partial [Actinomycetota bacterium]
MADLLVDNAVVVDGTGGPARPGSVLVEGDRVVAILDPGAPEAAVAVRFDARGRVVAPGFVDVHQHSDLTPFVEPTMDSMLRQGVTSIVVGNCGSSAFPFDGAPELAAMVGSDVATLGLEPWTFGEYLRAIDETSPALNVAALVGHGSLRQAVLGLSDRAPTAEETARMRDLLSDAVAEGAVGLSSGLIYVPGLHATTEELVAVAGGLGNRGLYASHVRGEGSSVFDAVAECVEVGRRAGVPSHVSHLKVEGRAMWGRAEELLELVDGERSRGADVSADQYPYTAWETELAAALPPWARTTDLAELLADPAGRRRLETALEDESWESVGQGIGWDRVLVGAHTADPGRTGQTIAAVASDLGIPPFEAVARLLIADPNAGMIGHAMF